LVGELAAQVHQTWNRIRFGKRIRRFDSPRREWRPVLSGKLYFRWTARAHG